jgi:hypothetical protein
MQQCQEGVGDDDDDDEKIREGEENKGSVKACICSFPEHPKH